MKQIVDYPPFYGAIKEHCPEMLDGIYTFKNLIYNPKDYPLTPDVIRHEEMHNSQQTEYQSGSNWIWRLPSTRAKEWWDRFLQDPAFRLSQDLPAYQVQLWELEKVKPEAKNKFINFFAENLTSKLYSKNGKPLINKGQAIKALQSKDLLKFRV